MFVGMDVYNNYLQVAVLDEKGKILNNSRLDDNLIKASTYNCNDIKGSRILVDVLPSCGQAVIRHK
jgi:hypothetical protein